MKQKMTQDEILYAIDKLGIMYKGERGKFIRSQGWRVKDFERELGRRLVTGEFRKDNYQPVIRPEIKSKFGVNYE